MANADDSRRTGGTTDPLESVASGAYNPGPLDERDGPTAELAAVQAQRNDLQLEEFPEGPYGASLQTERLGKSGPWEPGQASVSAYRDENPLASDRKLAEREPAPGAPRGSIEGQN